MHRILLAIAVTFALAGCADLLDPFGGDHDRCAGMGYRINTRGMADCVMTLRLRREDQQRQQPAAPPAR